MKHFFSLWRRWPVSFLAFLWFAGPAARAQAPAWQTVLTTTQASGSSSQVESSVADASGNVFIAGYFNGTVSFGNISLTSAGVNDMFVAKWSPTANSFAWAQRAGGAANDIAQRITISGTSVYVTGIFRSPTITFGSISLTNTGTVSTSDVFVVKLTDAGNTSSFAWAQRAGGTGQESSPYVAVEGANVYLTGLFTSTAGFGSTTLVSAGGRDIFVAKLTDAGNSSSWNWAIRMGNANANGDEDDVQGLGVNGADIYLSGTFAGAISFGNTTLNSSGVDDFDVFVAKLTDTGTGASYVWAQRAGGSNSVDIAHALVVSGTSVYVTGEFAGTTTQFGNIILTNANSSTTYFPTDIFVVKLTDMGNSANYVWAQRAGGLESDVPWGLNVSGPNLYIVGIFSDAATFGTTTLNAIGSYFDLFVAKITDLGTTVTFNWAQQASSPSDDNSSAVAVSGPRIYVGGYVTTPATFGNISVTGQASNKTAFLASLADPTLTATSSSTQPSAVFTLAPNPAHNSTTVHVPVLPGASNVNIALLDALGRPVRTTSLPLPAAGLRHEMNLRGLPTGIYALRVAAGRHASTRRLVVE